MRILSLSLRNLTRNFRRTLITALAVFFGVLAIVFLQGFVNGFMRTAIESSVLAKTAAIQVHKKGYVGADDPLKLNFVDDKSTVARILAVPGITAVAPRLAFDGMISNGSESTMFLAVGIDPTLEYAVCPKRRTNVAEGSRPLTAGVSKASDALVGKTLAESLDAQIGGTLVMQSSGPNSAGSNALDVEVSGFLPTWDALASKRMATVALPFAQDLLKMKGHITEYAVGVSDLDDVIPTAARVAAALGNEFEVTTWHDVDLATSERMSSQRWILGFIALVLFLLVATGIVNTMLMSVYERVREIGTMLAVGMRRRQVTALFLWEAVALGLIGASAGAAIGFLLVEWMGLRGLKMRFPGGDDVVIRPYMSLGYLGVVIAFAVAGTVLAAYYPAWRASRLRPADALRAT